MHVLNFSTASKLSSAVDKIQKIALYNEGIFELVLLNFNSAKHWYFYLYCNDHNPILLKSVFNGLTAFNSV